MVVQMEPIRVKSLFRSLLVFALAAHRKKMNQEAELFSYFYGLFCIIRLRIDARVTSSSTSECREFILLEIKDDIKTW